jgi:hypothetical protein
MDVRKSLTGRSASWTDIPLSSNVPPGLIVDGLPLLGRFDVVPLCKESSYLCT